MPCEVTAVSLPHEGSRRRVAMGSPRCFHQVRARTLWARVTVAPNMFWSLLWSDHSKDQGEEAACPQLSAVGYSFAGAAITKSHRIGGSGNSTILETRSPRSSCQQGWFLLRAGARGGNRFQTFLLESGGLLAVFGIPWVLAGPPQSLPSSSHGVLPVCVPLCLKFSLL